MDNQQPEHKRRVRYQGTHPKNFKEKYKEHEPEKYAQTVAKIIQKGNTPSGMHIPICVEEILALLDIKPGEIGLDATLGYGGHTAAMLSRLDGNGHIYALDVDPIESVKTKARLERMGYGSDILTVRHLNFANIDEVADEVGKFDFILADLGVSSMQIDNPDRGFTYKKDGPLDLRLDPQRGISGAERLRTMSQQEIEGMLTENADEPYAAPISKAITQALRAGNDIATTGTLRQIIGDALEFIPLSKREEAIKKSCQRSFQALRIDVNSEFEVLYEFLEKLPYVLAEGGRVAILTFHSGEDRLVKKSFKHFFREGLYSDIANDVIRPSPEECNNNTRSRPAKLRWATRSGG